MYPILLGKKGKIDFAPGMSHLWELYDDPACPVPMPKASSLAIGFRCTCLALFP